MHGNLGKKHPNRKKPPPFTEEHIEKLRQRRLGKNNPFYGKHHTKESNEKNRLAHVGKPTGRKGIKLSEEHINKLKLAKLGKHYPKNSLAKIGRKQSAETIEKRVSKLRGIKRPQWVKDKLRLKARRGKDSYFWRGGVCKLSKRIRELPEMYIWKNEVFKRDDWTCQVCGLRGGKLEAHHIKRFVNILKENYIKTLEEALICSELWDTSNGITLCTDCHKLTDNYGNK
jgi:hypothetical protein